MSEREQGDGGDGGRESRWKEAGEKYLCHRKPWPILRGTVLWVSFIFLLLLFFFHLRRPKHRRPIIIISVNTRRRTLNNTRCFQESPCKRTKVAARSRVYYYLHVYNVYTYVFRRLHSRKNQNLTYWKTVKFTKITTSARAETTITLYERLREIIICNRQKYSLVSNEIRLTYK